MLSPVLQVNTTCCTKYCRQGFDFVEHFVTTNNKGGQYKKQIFQLAIQGIQLLLVLLGLKGWCMRKIKNSLLKWSISSFKQCYNEIRKDWV